MDWSLWRKVCETWGNFFDFQHFLHVGGREVEWSTLRMKYDLFYFLCGDFFVNFSVYVHRFLKTVNWRALWMVVMKSIPAGCGSSAVLVTKGNKTCLPSSTWARSTIVHSRPSSQDKKCWCGTMTNILSTLAFQAQSLIWVLLQSMVRF